MKNFFTILGGMGTLATESFVRLLNNRTPAHSDQDYLNYVLVNHATVPDRTAYILDSTAANPVAALIEDIEQHSTLKPAFFVLTCNTAHTFFDQLQAATTIPILHMPRITAEQVKLQVPKEANKRVRVALLATQGMINSGVYYNEFDSGYFEVILPEQVIQDQIMALIYRDVKEQQFFNEELYFDILNKMIVEEHCDVAVLGCTELSLMQEVSGQTTYPVIDAQSELINHTISLALKNRQ